MYNSRRRRARGRGSRRGRDSSSVPHSPMLSPANNNSPAASVTESLDEAHYDFAEGEENIDERGNNVNIPPQPPINIQQVQPVETAAPIPNRVENGILFNIRRTLAQNNNTLAHMNERLDMFEARVDRQEVLLEMTRNTGRINRAPVPDPAPRQPNPPQQQFRVEDKHFPQAIMPFTGNGEPSAEEWIKSVRSFIEDQEGWTDTMKKTVFYCRTNDGAYSYLINDFGIRAHTFDEICAEIIKEYGGGNQDMVNSLQMKTLQQSDSETVSEFFIRFYKISSKISSRSDSDKMHDFISGLRYDIQQSIVHKQPNTLHQAVELAKNAEAWLAMYSKKKNAKSTPVQQTTLKPIFYSNSGQLPQRMNPLVTSGSPQNFPKVVTPATTPIKSSPQAATPYTPAHSNYAKRLDYNTPYRPQQFNNIYTADLDLTENYVLDDD